MLRDLEVIHKNLLEAYKAVLLLSGIDLEKLIVEHDDNALPLGHLPIPTKLCRPSAPQSIHRLVMPAPGTPQ